MKSSTYLAGVLGALASLQSAVTLPVIFQAETEQHTLDPYPHKPRLTFKWDGTFKLVVFSDLHFGEKPEGVWGPEQDKNSIILMKTVLASEKPDYVSTSFDASVLNGDLVTGENTYRENSTLLIDQIVAPLNQARVPFSSTHGNHDNQVNITHLEEIEREQKIAPLSYTRTAPAGVGGTEGPGNYWVPVYRHFWDRAPILILWFFDSRGGVSTNPNSTVLPDWVDSSVAGWIKSESKAMELAWGPADTRGALAFVHIPPHAVQSLQTNLDSTKNPGLNADKLGGGSVQASNDPSTLGNDGPFWDALTANVKNLHAIISGHDHGNEWCAREPAKDVVFCFNKHSGYGGYGEPEWGYGVRNIVFRSPDPKKGVDTWIRLQGGETRARVTLDDTYGRK
ncbi:hypothetical protein K443DRAFT_624447 [Laccaria amethystina LaAM-08-1]|uniref:Calcineurin-like phosphoesterase domain-containing protein n=1 Tax=Laccaria amethystina LaAM-08-1 TaxID=1095629 RepID=A0A0C9XCM1_9AGAR|nr:hypothetical protein K443DRAFT_624447 [Laccaria amethystina LaAM-08-1]